jgi:hypothetical protein
MAAVVLGVEKREGGEQRVRCGEAEAGVCFIGPGRRAAAVEFYSSSVSNELKGEEETGRHRFSGGSEGGMMALQSSSSRMEEGGSRRFKHDFRFKNRRFEILLN